MSVPFGSVTGWISPVKLTVCEAQLPLLFGIVEGNMCEQSRYPKLTAKRDAQKQADSALPILQFGLFFESFELEVQNLSSLCWILTCSLCLRHVPGPTLTWILRALRCTDCGLGLTASRIATIWV
jgi:hypothetical protein